MHGKEFFRTIFMSFFIVVTLVDIAMFVMGSALLPDMKFGYEAFLSPIIYAACSMIPFVVMYSKKELSRKQMLVRYALQLLSLEVLLTLLAFGGESLKREQPLIIVTFCIAVFVVYVLVHLVLWLLDLKAAQRMTEDLHVYQSRAEE